MKLGRSRSLSRRAWLQSCAVLAGGTGLTAQSIPAQPPTPATRQFDVKAYGATGVRTENATGGLFLEKADEIRKYQFIFDQICAMALRPEETTALLSKLTEEPLWKLRQRGFG